MSDTDPDLFTEESSLEALGLDTETPEPSPDPTPEPKPTPEPEAPASPESESEAVSGRARDAEERIRQSREQVARERALREQAERQLQEALSRRQPEERPPEEPDPAEIAKMGPEAYTEFIRQKTREEMQQLLSQERSALQRDFYAERSLDTLSGQYELSREDRDTVKPYVVAGMDPEAAYFAVFKDRIKEKMAHASLDAAAAQGSPSSGGSSTPAPKPQSDIDKLNEAYWQGDGDTAAANELLGRW